MGHIVDEAATLDNTQPPHVASIFKLARCRNLSPNQRTEGGKPGRKSSACRIGQPIPNLRDRLWEN